MTTTLEDIAKEVGTSITTVSRVLNKKELDIPVSKETEEKIIDAAEKMNYRPNFHARAISAKKTLC